MELNRYMGWGAFVGGTAGLAYGLARERGGFAPLAIFLDTIAGFTAGMLAGGAVYLVRTARDES
ncbi:MAG: hypothetical protein M3P24_01060 [Gemmatimonadota bacterium]|nr:hypothetical protein [Gemmatimonadota bacterium]